VEPWTARQSRHLSYLAEFTSDIRHISGVDNVVADTLSRPPAGEIKVITAIPVQVDYEAIAEAQRPCPETVAAGITSTTLQQVQFGGTQLLCDTSGPHPRPIPAAHCPQLFTTFHSLAHPGTKATGRLMGNRVTWPYMKCDIARWVADCQECGRATVTRQPPAAVQPIPVPTQRFSHIMWTSWDPSPSPRRAFGTCSPS